jgi:NitT/TauT family transport system substrate-binding protein
MTVSKPLARLALAAALLAAGPAAGAETDVKFTLDWKFQGPTAAFIAARDLGHFEAEGLDVTVDSGNGSAGAITRVASGAYQMGFADINSLVEFNAANPGQAAKAVMMVYDAPPFGVYALKKSGIEKPQDLVGKRLGAPVFDASYKLFPAFARQVGIDPAAVPRVNMDPPLREAMLVRGDVDAISGHYFSSILDLRAKGVAVEDINAMLYKDHGMDFYGNAVIAGGAFMAESPAAVTGFVRAAAKGWKWVIANRDEAVDLVAKADPLIDKALERERLDMAIAVNILTPYVREHGMGGVDPARLASSVRQLASALDLKDPPAPSAIWTDAFLPPAEERKIAD